MFEQGGRPVPKMSRRTSAARIGVSVNARQATLFAAKRWIPSQQFLFGRPLFETWRRSAPHPCTEHARPGPYTRLSSGGLFDESLDYLDMARHSDMRVSLQRFTKQRLRLFAITRSAAID